MQDNLVPPPVGQAFPTPSFQDKLLSAGRSALDAGKSFASGVVDYGIKGPTRFGCHVTAEVADFASKGIAITGVFASSLLLMDSYLHLDNRSVLVNQKNEKLFLLEVFDHFVNPTKRHSPEDAEAIKRVQALVGVGLLCVATPLASMACRKVCQIANYYRQPAE
ncbi:MAG: hypothetical protein KDK40_04500 [Chlamydiia bacterium]|nr:hypothetical protein [Chlamydiia bacterium]